MWQASDHWLIIGLTTTDQLGLIVSRNLWFQVLFTRGPESLFVAAKLIDRAGGIDSEARGHLGQGPWLNNR